MDEAAKLRVDVRNGLAHLAFNDPPDHFLRLDVLGELVEALERAGGQPGIRALLLTGSGGHFSSGFEYGGLDEAMHFSLLERFRGVCSALLALDFPTVAVVDGRLRNWACDLLWFVDVVVATPDTSFLYDNLSIGSYPPLGALLLTERMGAKAAFRLLLEGEPISAVDAVSLDLVTSVHPREEQVGEIKRLLALLANRSGPVVGMMAKVLRRERQSRLQVDLEDLFAEYLNLLPDLEDYHEGLAARREGRQPVWRNR